MRKLTLALAATAMAVPAIPATPAFGHVYRGTTNHTHCRRANGTVGIIVGGAGGALVGRAVAGRRHRTTGTIVGAAAGALVGREVARSRRRCR
jgi:uncharacterized protein YcfJ